MAKEPRREYPDYIYSREESLRLIERLRAYYGRLEVSPKFWLEEAVIPYGQRNKTMYSVRSNILMRCPQFI